MEKAKKPFYKRVWFWVVLVFILLAAIGSNSRKESDAEQNEVVETIESDRIIETYEVTIPDGVDIKTEYDNDIVVAAKMTLDRFISDYKISLAPQLWTIADFDNDGAIMALTDVTLSNGSVEGAAFVLTPIFEGSKMTGATPHYVAVGNTVYGDDGYCDDVFSNIQSVIDAFSQSETTQSGSQIETNVTEAPIYEQDNANSLDTYAVILQSVLKEHWGNNCSVSAEGNIITVNVWQEGVMIEATAAAAGNQEYINAWNNMVSELTEAQNSYQQNIRDMGGENAIVVLNLLNDMNTENVILTIAQGVVVLDYVNGVNLLGIG